MIRNLVWGMLNLRCPLNIQMEMSSRSLESDIQGRRPSRRYKFGSCQYTLSRKRG